MQWQKKYSNLWAHEMVSVSEGKSLFGGTANIS